MNFREMFCLGRQQALHEFVKEQPPFVATTTLWVVVLALQETGGGVRLICAWETDGSKCSVLGRVVDAAPELPILQRLVFEIPVASGMEARSGETEGLDPKDDSPVGAAETPQGDHP